MNTQLMLTGLTIQQVRNVAATLSGARDGIATHNNGGSLAPHWAPIVHNEGPTLFTVFTPTIPAAVAGRVIAALSE